MRSNEAVKKIRKNSEEHIKGVMGYSGLMNDAEFKYTQPNKNYQLQYINELIESKKIVSIADMPVGILNDKRSSFAVATYQYPLNNIDILKMHFKSIIIYTWIDVVYYKDDKSFTLIRFKAFDNEVHCMSSSIVHNDDFLDKDDFKI